MDEVQLPRITSGVDPQVVAVLQQLSQQLGAVATATDRTADSAEAQEGAFGKMGEKLKAVYGDLKDFADKVSETADAIAALATEQSRLDTQSARLNLDFDQGAAAAGRFADETDAMRVATTAAEAGLRLTQTELDGFMRRAGQYAQATGVDMREATQKLTEALMAGSQEGLNRFGGELARTAVGGSTLGERLRALVTDANGAAAATDDAASAMERFRDNIDDAKRTMASAFTERFMSNLSAMRTDLGDGAERARDMERALRTVGTLGADILTVVGGTVATVIGGIATAIHSAGNAIVRLTEAFVRFNAMDFSGARRAVSAAFSESDESRALTDFTAGAGSRTLAAIQRIGSGGTGQDSDVASGDTTMRFTTEEVSAANANARARNRRAGGGGGGGTERMTAQQLAMAREEMRAAEQAKADEMLSRLMGEATGGDTLDNLMRRESERAANDNAADRKVEDSIKNMERIRSAATEMGDVGRMAFGAFGNAFTNAMLAVATGKASFDDAMTAMLQTTLETIAQQAAVESLKNLAIAAGLQATTYGIPNPGSISAGTAAAIWAAVAVAAGAGAAGVAALSGGGGAAPSGTTPVPQRPTPSGREATSGGGPTVVNNYFNAPVIDGRSSTRAEVGTELQRGYLDRESRRTQGARRAA